MLRITTARSVPTSLRFGHLGTEPLLLGLAVLFSWAQENDVYRACL